MKRKLIKATSAANQAAAEKDETPERLMTEAAEFSIIDEQFPIPSLTPRVEYYDKLMYKFMYLNST